MNAKKPPARSVLILRRRVLEELSKPGPDGRPRVESDAQLARILGVTAAHISHFLHGEGPQFRGVSWRVLDKFAVLFDCYIWELFFIPSLASEHQEVRARLLLARELETEPPSHPHGIRVAASSPYRRELDRITEEYAQKLNTLLSQEESRRQAPRPDSDLPPGRASRRGAGRSPAPSSKD